MPMRNSMRFSGMKSALRIVIARWISTAARTASTKLTNSTRMLSPAVLATRPRLVDIAGSINSDRSVSVSALD